MIRALLLTVLMYAPSAFAASTASGPDSKTASTASPFPLQLEARVPFAPTAFPSAGHTYAVYELHLTNFSGSPIRLQRIDVLDAERPAATPLASYAEERLNALLQSVDTPSSGVTEIRSGATVIAFIWLAIDGRVRIAARLLHRVVTTTSTIEGVVVTTNHDKLRVLASPVRGAGWLASDGPSNDPSNHHRRGTLAINGQVTISRRYAIDWMIQRDHAISSGDSHDLRSYYAYNQPVFAVADATVERARDGIPNNTPGSPQTFQHAVPITMDTVGGNTIVLNLGTGQYAWYFHLAPGSLRVKTGDRVRRGQPLAQIGCSGDPPIPHLHFEVTTSPLLLAGEGLPYLIDHYRIWSKDNRWESQTGELPLNGVLVDFGRRGADGN
jgi:murein DD-endopeptidase MepM/ murein hydrolase activator NlpD